MKSQNLVLMTVAITAIATVLLYGPASLAIYKVTEPYFACPVKTAAKEIVVRNDALGEGDFGAKRRNGRSHSGIDIKAAVGTPVYAAKSGIAFCGDVPTGYGKYVMIYHPDGYQTMYGHLSNWCIYSPIKVRRGELIGLVGKTGNASSKYIQPHLHFEIRKDGESKDPRSLMR